MELCLDTQGLLRPKHKELTDTVMLGDSRHGGASVDLLHMSSIKHRIKVMQQVCNTMLFIAEVCQYAMVALDKLFLDLSVRKHNNTRGKV